jgi:hypothetical protein
VVKLYFRRNRLRKNKNDNDNESRGETERFGSFKFSCSVFNHSDFLRAAAIRVSVSFISAERR